MLRVASTFSGIGGSSLGYKLAGLDVIYAVEFEPKAAAAYAANFPGTKLYSGDIANVTADMIDGPVDILDGSPPCQGFSLANTRAMGQYNDPRNRLFEHYARLARELQPRAIIMENVTGMLRRGYNVTFAEINDTLRDAGYDIAVRKLNAWWYGVPQSRNRLIWIGYRKDLGIKPTHPEPTHSTPATAASVAPQLRYLSAKQSTNKMHTLDTYKDAQHHPSPTVIAAGNMIVIDDQYKHRTLTSQERLVLCGFPPDFHTTPKGAGNAVPPPLARAVGAHVKQTLEEHDGKRS